MKKLLLVLLLAFPLLAGNLELKEGFVAAHTEMLMDSTIDPLNAHVSADMSIDGDDLLSLKGKIWVEMELFSSDNADRDEHMHEADEATLFPSATYTISSLTKEKEANAYTIHGSLNFHGQDKAFMAEAEVIEKDGMITISSKSSLLVSDYGVEMPCMVFMCVRDQVDIFAKVVLVRK